MNTLLEYIPFGVAIAGALGLVEKRLASKVDKTACNAHVEMFAKALDGVEEGMKSLSEKFEKVAADVAYIKGRLEDR
jgi:hypothetical protein